MEQELAKLRKEIDGVDKEIIRLIEERVELAKEIGSLKRNIGLPVADPKRENEVLANVTENTKLDKKFIRRIYKSIMDYCKDEEQRK